MTFAIATSKSLLRYWNRDPSELIERFKPVPRQFEKQFFTSIDDLEDVKSQFRSSFQSGASVFFEIRMPEGEATGFLEIQWEFGEAGGFGIHGGSYRPVRHEFEFRRYVFASLIVYLLSEFPDKPIETCCSFENRAATRFVESFGFKPYRKLKNPNGYSVRMFSLDSESFSKTECYSQVNKEINVWGQLGNPVIKLPSKMPMDKRTRIPFILDANSLLEPISEKNANDYLSVFSVDPDLIPSYSGFEAEETSVESLFTSIVTIRDGSNNEFFGLRNETGIPVGLFTVKRDTRKTSWLEIYGGLFPRCNSESSISFLKDLLHLFDKNAVKRIEFRVGEKNVFLCEHLEHAGFDYEGSNVPSTSDKCKFKLYSLLIE